MSTPLRWAVLGIAVLMLIGLVGWARGDEHHHGDDVGSVARIT